MHSAHLRPYPEGISPHRVVYTVIVSSLKALLLPSFSGALHLIKKIHYDEGAQERAENSIRFMMSSFCLLIQSGSSSKSQI
mgnify:CR=1 FL=1